MKNNIKDFYYEREHKIKKILKISIIVITIAAIITLISVYFVNLEFREFIDINIFRKDITTTDIATIDLSINKNNQIYCYGKNICVLNDKNLKIFNSQGQNLTDMPIDINTPIFSSSGKYLAIAEKNGKNFSAIFDKTFLWNQQIEGEILQILINKNGYIAVITKDTTYRSIITLYDQNGKSIFKNYLANSRIIDVSISNDNKYLAYAELDTSGAVIQSSIKIISVEKALENPKEAIIYTYSADTNKMLVNIHYQERGNLICIFDDSVQNIENNQTEEIIKFEKNYTYISGNLKNSIAFIKEEKTGIFNSKTELNILNIANKQIKLYNIEEIVKDMYTYENTIAINVGNEIYFLNTNGMLIKKYTSKQEITNVILSDSLGLIVYKDKIEIIEF